MTFDFTFALMGFWALVLAVGAGHRTMALSREISSRPSSSLWLWMRRKLILPVTYGKKQAEAVADIYTIPPRLESILLAIYIILNLIMCLPGYDLFDGNQWYPEKKLQLARYIADRTGFLSTAQSPMLWVFAARNDPFMWITGWSFATFNRFHRWVARISVFHAVVHSIAYSIFALYEGSYRAYWNAEYWWCGAIATIMMSLMLGASAYYFRAKFYDLFLMVHIAMSFVFLITLFESSMANSTTISTHASQSGLSIGCYASLEQFPSPSCLDLPKE
ncbi:putative ferric reductase transmembrane component-like domain-containing protein [Septoria linicola]|nr:putative ferric reductase transmembrane component-like domain-containing protein [Septoria linicola]